jgi:N-acetylmuramoyl-L-alanine amidase
MRKIKLGVPIHFLEEEAFMKLRIILLCSLVLAGTSWPFGKADAHPIIGNADVVIDAGHGGIDSGAVYGNVYEKDINLEIAKQTSAILRNKGYFVILNRANDYALSDDNRWLRNRSRHIRDLSQRSQLANLVNPKVFVSIHVNWAPNPSKGGPLVLYQNNRDSILLAQLIQKQLNAVFGSKGIPVHGKTYYWLNYVKASAVIIETGFITNEHDRKRLTDQKGQHEIARHISAGIEEYLTLN